MNAFEQLKLWARYSRITAILIVLSISVALLSSFGGDIQFIHFLFISEYSQGLPESLTGQFWRLFTLLISL